MISSVRFARLICFVLSFYSLTSFAQKAELELVAGPAMVSTRLSDGNNGNRKLKIAPLAGVGLHYHFTKHWSMTTHLLYEVKGVSAKGEVLYDPYPANNPVFVSYKLVNNLNYLTLPLMAHYSFGNKIRWYAGAGGYLSYLLKAKQNITIYASPTNKQNFDITDSSNKVDAGIRLAIGAAVPVTEKLKLTCSLNESIGLVDISKSVDPTTGQQYKQSVMTNSLSLQVGISYVLKGK